MTEKLCDTHDICACDCEDCDTCDCDNPYTADDDQTLFDWGVIFLILALPFVAGVVVGLTMSHIQ